jgi:hypothetical protein
VFTVEAHWSARAYTHNNNHNATGDKEGAKHFDPISQLASQILSNTATARSATSLGIGWVRAVVYGSGKGAAGAELVAIDSAAAARRRISCDASRQLRGEGTLHPRVRRAAPAQSYMAARHDNGMPITAQLHAPLAFR